MDNDLMFKVCILGDGGVGKTSLVHRYMTDSFKEKYISTLGVQHHRKLVSIKDFNISLNVWDISGQSKFTSFKELYLKGTDFFIVVFDVMRAKSFENLPLWIKDVLKMLKNNKKACKSEKFGILANKIDLLHNGIDIKDKKNTLLILKEKANDLINKMNSNLEFFYETSAKTGQNVPEIFEHVAVFLLNDYMTKKYNDEYEFKSKLAQKVKFLQDVNVIQ